jgi:hypothetical protein
VVKDFADFLAALNREGAAYVVIGGMAVLRHIPYRTTRDIDVLIEPTIENARRVRDAVKAWGGFEPEYSPEDFVSGDVLSFGGLLRVEVHSRVPGATWETVRRNQVHGEILGVQTTFASLVMAPLAPTTGPPQTATHTVPAKSPKARQARA